MKASLIATIVLLTGMSVGQSMTSHKTVSTWNKPAVESSFNHCLTTNDKMNCWIPMPGAAVWVDSSATHTVAVDSSCNGYVYNDGKANSWTKHTEWGCVKEISYDSDGNLYGLVHYNSTGKGYYLSKWNGSAWVNSSCCFVSFRMRGAVVAAYDINGTIWTSTNHGATVKSQPWCTPAGASALAPIGLDDKGNAAFYVACSTGKIWLFDGVNWGQLPGSATAIAVGLNGAIYIVNGDVEHWNDTSSAWDDMVTNNKPVANLSVGNSTNVWAIGPTSTIWRTWDTGLMLTHSYGGSVSCGQGVPQALCNTFTHKVSHQICFGGHCGAVSASSWNGQGGWGPDAQVFATPWDLWTCLLAGEPAGPCGLAENEASMECSGGGSNSDNASGINYVVDDSTDVMGFTTNLSSSGPMLVARGPGHGYYLAEVTNNTTEECYVSDPVPVCPAESPENTEIKAEYFGGLDWEAKAYAAAIARMDADRAGLDSPYVFDQFYLATQNPDGTLSNVICFGDPHAPTAFLDGNADARPHCR